MPTAPTPHTALPAAPSTDDPANFDTEADAFVGALETFGDQMDALATNAYNNAVEANADAIATAADRVQTGLDRTAASNSASDASGFADAASGFATAAASSATAAANAAAGAAFTSTSTTSNAIATGSKTWAVGAGYSYQSGQFALVSDSANAANWLHGQVTDYSGGNLTINVTRVNGSGTKTSWNVGPSSPEGPAGQGVPPGGTTDQVLKKSSGTDYDAAWADQDVTKILRSARTSNTQLAAADKGKLIEITGSGGFTQTFVGASTLGSGWFVHYVNSSTGDITLDPNSTETIGGVNAATTAVLKPGQSTLITSNGSNLFFAQAPSSFRNMEIFTSSGTFTPKAGVVRYFIKAVGGGGGGSYGGGAAGGYAEGFANITSSETVTIGAGGGSGSSGGTTSVGSIVTCYGGGGGATSSGGGPSNGGSSTFTGGLALKGADGGGHSNGGSYGGTGGASPFGGAGGAANNTNSGTQASNNTGSGGGGNASGSGGSGGSGLVIFYW